MWKRFGKTGLFANISLQKRTTLQAEMEPGRQVHPGGPRRKSFDLGPFLEDQNFESLKNRTWAVVSPPDRLTLLKNPSGKILSVLRLNVMFRKPTISRKRQQHFKASGRKVAKKAVQTPQKSQQQIPRLRVQRQSTIHFRAVVGKDRTSRFVDCRRL